MMSFAKTVLLCVCRHMASSLGHLMCLRVVAVILGLPGMLRASPTSVLNCSTVGWVKL